MFNRHPLHVEFARTIPLIRVIKDFNPKSPDAGLHIQRTINAILAAGIMPAYITVEDGAAIRLVFVVWTDYREASEAVESVLDVLWLMDTSE